jgi:hypothetical protein
MKACSPAGTWNHSSPDAPFGRDSVSRQTTLITGAAVPAVSAAIFLIIIVVIVVRHACSGERARS